MQGTLLFPRVPSPTPSLCIPPQISSRDARLNSPRGTSAGVRGMMWRRMGEETHWHGWLHHVPALRGTETPVSCRMEHCRLSWAGSTSSSLLPEGCRGDRLGVCPQGPALANVICGQVLAAAFPDWCSHCPLSLTPVCSLWECPNPAPHRCCSAPSQQPDLIYHGVPACPLLPGDMALAWAGW